MRTLGEVVAEATAVLVDTDGHMLTWQVATLAGSMLIAEAIRDLTAVVDLHGRALVGLLTPDLGAVDGVEQHAPGQAEHVELVEAQDVDA